MGLATYCKHVVGVDIDEGLIKKAKCALRDAYISNVTFIQGDCRETLDVKPESQDVVLMHALAYHQSAPDLKNMLAEAMRILKPGGIVALRDSDAGGDLIEPMTAEIEFALSVSRAWNKHEDHHLYFGRTQRRVLSESGFVDVHISASYENFARTLEDARNHGQTLKEVYESFRPLITKDEADRAINAWLGWSRSPDAVFFRCRCEAIGHKPLQ
jgi:ubiquinone/menaquinone biosynthesis C-methylase UbiE